MTTIQPLLIALMISISVALGFAALWWMERKHRISEQHMNKNTPAELGVVVAFLERNNKEHPKELKTFEEALDVMNKAYRK